MSDYDKRLMYKAIELARRGEGLAAPNPMVGAILVRDGEIVGAGYHIFANVKHAEILALEDAGERAHSATLYCSLEPCCHYGRTPPCTDALIGAGIARAVIAVADPDLRVSGQGIAQLRAAGIEVVVGIGEAEARELNHNYFAAKNANLRREK